MKQLTLLITIHSQFEAVNFFLDLTKSFREEIDIIFSFDNCKSEIDENILKKIRNNNLKYFILGENQGKLSLVIKSAKLINTPFFKIVDQDDTMDLRNISIINEKLSLIKNENLIKHKALKIKGQSNKNILTQSTDINIINEQVKAGKDLHLAQQTNCDTIYPTKIIQKMNDFKLTRQQFHNDVLLSNFCIGFGSKLVKIDASFYIQFHGMGQTNKITIERSKCIIELYENYKRINNQESDFKVNRLMWKMKIAHKSFIAAFTKWYLIGEDRKSGKEYYKKSIKLLDELWKK